VNKRLSIVLILLMAGLTVIMVRKPHSTKTVEPAPIHQPATNKPALAVKPILTAKAVPRYKPPPLRAPAPTGHVAKAMPALQLRIVDKLTGGPVGRTNPPAAVSLAWTASPDPTVLGYYLVFGGASQDYTNTTDVDGESTTNATLTNVAYGDTYYFNINAYNISTTSPYAGEISYTMPATPPAPVLNTPASK
jgi:hypothetical protein